MRHTMQTGTLVLALLGVAGLAAAQSGGSTPGQIPRTQAPGGSSAAHPGLALDASEQRDITQGLSREQAQQVPSGYQGQVGSKIPNSLHAQPLPSSVQAPHAKGFFYVKLPDRVLLVDPDDQLVVQIVAADVGGAGTTGSGSSSPSMNPADGAGSTGQGGSGSGNSGKPSGDGSGMGR
jgi:hypothetical protein